LVQSAPRGRGNRLWRHPDFAKLWAGQTISLFGSSITALALPSVAILTLGANAYQVGLLQAVQFLAFPLLGLPAGVWVDRLPRRAVMIVADVGRALALGSVPLAWARHSLTLGQLYLVALVVGVLTVFFDVAYQSYLPTLIDRVDLIEGNSKLEISRSASEVAGRGLGGVLIQWLGAPLSVLVDALSFIASVIGLAAIRKPEEAASSSTTSKGFWPELRTGVDVVIKDPLLRNIALCTATTNLATAMVGAVFLIFAYRNLHLPPALVGGVLAFGNLGIAGAFFAAGIAHRFGLGKTLLLAILMGGLGTLMTAVAAFGFPVIFLLLSQLLQSFAIPVYNVNQVSLRQAITQSSLQGRMNATMRTIVWGTLPVGSLIGGVAGSTIGILPTILIAGFVFLAAALWIRLSAVFRLVSIPST
jgi:MFS family permease